MSGERYTVVGAGGFVGSRLCAHLEAAGHEVRRTGRADPLPEGPLGRVLWCAGVTRDFRERPFDTVRAHVCDLAGLLEDGDFERLVYLSSTRVYRAAEHDLYNASKLLGESLCLASGRAGVRVARLATVCAAASDSPDVVSELARAAVRTGTVTLRSDPASARDYILLDDAVPALAALADAGGAPVYDVASGRNVTNRELAAWLTELTGCAVETAPGAEHVSYPPIDVSAAAADLGLRPRELRSELPAIVAAQRG